LATTLFVTRHHGAVDWLREQGVDADRVAEHLTAADIRQLRKGDIVIGALPVNIVAKINARGAGYRHLVMDLALADRGVELTAVTMKRCGARLETFQVKPVKAANNRRAGGLRSGFGALRRGAQFTGQEIWVGLLGAALLLITSWVADGLKGDDFPLWEHYLRPLEVEYLKLWLVLGLCAAWFVFALLLRASLRKLLPLRSVSRTDTGTPQAAMIALLSKQEKGRFGYAGGTWYYNDTSNMRRNFSPEEMLDPLLLPKEMSRWSVVALVRGIQKNQPVVNRLALLPSAASIETAPQVIELLQALFPDLHITLEQAVDFESIDDGYHRLVEVVRQLRYEGYSENDLVADFTGGQKPSSVAMVLMTLHNDVQCQYHCQGSGGAVGAVDEAHAAASVYKYNLVFRARQP
jgi:CRISPR-associated protein Csx16